MIRISHNGAALVIDVDHGLGNTAQAAIRLSWTCGSDIEAAALARILRDRMGDRVMAIGTEAYDRGWADAKKKRARLKKWWRAVL